MVAALHFLGRKSSEESLSRWLITFGARKSMLSFWKEYILYMWKNKTITFQFNPSFDSTTISRSSIKKVVDSKTDIDNEDSRFERLKKLKKRIKEI